MRARSWVPLVVLVLCTFPRPGAAQERQARWQRGGDAVRVPVTTFHSPMAANLPTAETLAQGEFQFEISHRFDPAISTGIETLFGLDGPVVNRLGLAYAFHDRLFVTFQRSNLDDNWDLNAKVRIAEGGREGVPWMVGAVGGAAWNTEVEQRSAGDSRNFQFYGQAIFNALLWRRFAVGVVPSYVYNAYIRTPEVEHALTLGLNGQVYFGSWSLLGEWNIVEGAVAEFEHDPVTLGIELETGGHFFKLVITNTTRMNPAQFLPGADRRFEPDEWRLGFNITRLLRFWGS